MPLELILTQTDTVNALIGLGSRGKNAFNGKNTALKYFFFFWIIPDRLSYLNPHNLPLLMKCHCSYAI